MSLREYNNLNENIQRHYMETCMPCMESTDFYKGKCKNCDTMKEYTKSQEQKI